MILCVSMKEIKGEFKPLAMGILGVLDGSLDAFIPEDLAPILMTGLRFRFVGLKKAQLRQGQPR